MKCAELTVEGADHMVEARKSILNRPSSSLVSLFALLAPRLWLERTYVELSPFFFHRRPVHMFLVSSCCS
jgi:hypothetical protein